MTEKNNNKRFSTIAVIPARGGSKGIPRKNVRFLRGRPLISYTIETAKKCREIDCIVVSTDDDEIAHVASAFGCEAVMRPPELAADDVPLDPVIHHAVKTVEEKEGRRFDAVITMQPTSPLLSHSTVGKALARFSSGKTDTLISVVDDRHLSWTEQNGKYVPLYEKRVNRQYLPANFRETGGFVIAKREHVTATSRFGSIIDLFEISHAEAVDIDSFMDWWLADKLLGRRRVLIRTDGYEEIGLGHVSRALMLASKLIDHELLFVTKANTIGERKIADSFYKLKVFNREEELAGIFKDANPNIVINDILDTDTSYIQSLKNAGIFVVNFEDLGKGAEFADVVINALYESKSPAGNFFFGKDYYCLRDEFSLLLPKPVEKEVKEVLITFGGTDPQNYTERVLKILDRQNRRNFKVSIITGLGYSKFDSLYKTMENLSIHAELHRNVSTIGKYMRQADLVFTSAGRTVFEVASLGTPAIVIAQNEREMTHTFAQEENGIVNLGLGYRIGDDEILKAFEQLSGDYSLRKKMSAIMLSQDFKQGMDNVLKVIFEKFEDFERKISS